MHFKELQQVSGGDTELSHVVELLDKHCWLGGGCIGLNCYGEAAAILGESPVCCKVKLVLF